MRKESSRKMIGRTAIVISIAIIVGLFGSIIIEKFQTVQTNATVEQRMNPTSDVEYIVANEIAHGAFLTIWSIFILAFIAIYASIAFGKIWKRVNEEFEKDNRR